MMLNWASRGAKGLGLAAALLALAACGSSRSPLAGIIGDIPPPDEFQVIARKPLEMPAAAELPEPRPGAPSRLDADPKRDAINALLGASGREPAVAVPSAGEQVLLSAANAAAASSEVRVQLEQDKITAEENKPYEPPSLIELLGGGGSDEEKYDKDDVLDPLAESQRLLREGIMAPSNPDAAAETEADSGEESKTVGKTY